MGEHRGPAINIEVLIVMIPFSRKSAIMQSRLGENFKSLCGWVGCGSALEKLCAYRLESPFEAPAPWRSSAWWQMS